MNAKVFTFLLTGVVVFGAIIGAAFVGGIALGKSQGAEAAQNGPTAQLASGLGQDSPGRPDPQSLDQLRQRFQSGQANPEDLAQFRQQFQGQFQRVEGSQSFSGTGGLTGTIENIESNTLTINTPQGPLQASVAADTTIQVFSEGTLADLLTGMRVTVTGQRGEDGTLEARSILIVPEGADGFFGGGFFGGRQQRDQQSP